MGCRVSSIVPTRFGVSITKVAERCIRSMAENARMTQRWPLVRLTCARLVDRYTLLPPEVLKPRRRQLGVPNRVLNASMAEPVLDGSRIVPGVR